jgi:uncharacterized protein
MNVQRTGIFTVAARCFVFVTGLFLMAFGVGVTVKAGLGTSPISSTPLVLSITTSWTLGQILMVLQVVFIITQILLLRKRFPPIQLLQIPVSLLFGWFCDLGLAIVSGIHPATYIDRLLLTLGSTVVVGFGVFLEIKPNVLMLPGEGVVKALAIVTKRDFGTIKIAFDCALVATAACLSLILLHRLEGVREGTIISVFLVGTLVHFFNRHLTFFNALAPPVEKLVAEAKAQAVRPVIITIARQYYSGGHSLGEMLAEKLGWKLYDKEIISEVARTSGMSEESVRKIDERAPSRLQDIYLNSNEYLSEQQSRHDQVFGQEVRIILNAARTGSCIIVGRLANFILQDTPNVISVFIHANEESRIKRMVLEQGVTESQALHEIRKMDANRKRFCFRRTGKDWSEADNYNLSFDSALFTEEQMIDMILIARKNLKNIK